MCFSSFSFSAEPWEQEAGDGKSNLLPPIPASPAGPLTRAGYFCVSPSIWLLIHHPCPRCPYMGKAEEEELLAGGNPEFPEVTGWILVQTFTQISHEVGK